ncbi:ATP-binding protein [Mucilaginibacter glaciei]|uniref:ATP-binding protein n=1 Tax=Mucilaginibacter glaciei TaxID=2772109 RepID=A0A926NZ19_9SPHI|nr:ATP-binding protein [Mucilaginibacter glaciei]MBD1394294.1 ATP-binding protein [Mucilaginibacter glaciei]
MIQITDEFKKKIVAALMEARAQYSGFDTTFANKYGINEAVFSTLKSGKTDKLLSNGKWLTIARLLDVKMNDKKWHLAETDVFVTIKEDVLFCKQHSKARIYVDECGIGKTFTAKYLCRSLINCFYVDASQCKTKQAFIREIARTIGVDHNDRYVEVKANIKYWLTMVPEPIIIVDEAGDLEYNAFLELKELWNATENVCGWYLMGADGLRKQIEKGIRNKKVGYREIFSRFSESYSSTVPQGREERIAFHKNLIEQVLIVNMEDTSQLNDIVIKCLGNTKDLKKETIGGLRRAESLLLLND